MMQMVTSSGGTAALHGGGPRACHLRAQEVGSLSELTGRPGRAGAQPEAVGRGPQPASGGGGLQPPRGPLPST